jgi:hypothetical protein
MATTITTLTENFAASLPQKKGDPPNFGTVKSGRALAFDGAVDYLNTGYVAKTEGITNTITVACWIKTTDVTADYQWIWNFYEDNSKGWGLNISDENGLLKILEDIGGDDNELYDATIVNDTWYRVVVVMDDLVQKLYVNGSLSGSGTTSAPDGLDSFTSTLSIGSRTGTTSPWAGSMSDFQIWNTAWSLADVTNDYRHPEMLAHTFSGTSLTESNLKLWYPMTEGNPESPQTTIFDGSPKVLGSELTTNGDFETGDFTGWSIAVDTSEVTDHDGVTNVAHFIEDGLNRGCYQSKLVAGKVYKVEFDLKVISGAVYLGHSTSFVTGSALSPSTWTSFSGYYTAIDEYLRCYSYGTASHEWYVKNISYKEVQRGNHATSVFYGDELITSDYADNGTFTNDNGNWAVLDPESTSGVSISSWSGTAGNGLNGGLTVNTSDTSTEIQGVQLGTGYLDTIVAGKTYRVSIDMKSSHATATDDYVIGLGGAVSSAFNITTSYVSYTKDIVAASDAALLVYNTNNASGRMWYIDNVSVKEIGLSDQSTAMGQETIFQPVFVGQSRKKVFGDTATYAEITTDITDINDGKSISLWFNPQNEIPASSASYYGVLIGSNNTNSNIHINSATQIQMRDDTSGVEFTWDVPTMSVGEWYHIAVVFDDDRYYTLYLNGSFISKEDNDAFSGLNVDRIGGSSGGAEFQFDGIIDEISYWTKELTQSDVTEMYNDGVPLDLLTHSSTSDLVHYWRNNNLHTDGKWKDLKGSNNITFWKTNDYEAIFPEGTTTDRDINGFFLTHPNKNYLSLDGSANITIPDSPVLQLGNGDFSIEFWLKRHHKESTVYIISKQEDSSNYWNINLQKWGDLEFVSAISGSIKIQARFDKDAHDYQHVGEWHHYIFTAEREASVASTKLIWYLDGEVATGGDGSVSSDNYEVRTNTVDSIDVDSDISIGSQVASNTTGYPPTDVSLDDIRVYKKVLTPAEVLKNYRHGSGKHKD